MKAMGPGEGRKVTPAASGEVLGDGGEQVVAILIMTLPDPLTRLPFALVVVGVGAFLVTGRRRGEVVGRTGDGFIIGSRW